MGTKRGVEKPSHIINQLEDWSSETDSQWNPHVWIFWTNEMKWRCKLIQVYLGAKFNNIFPIANI